MDSSKKNKLKKKNNTTYFNQTGNRRFDNAKMKISIENLIIDGWSFLNKIYIILVYIKFQTNREIWSLFEKSLFFIVDYDLILRV